MNILQKNSKAKNYILVNKIEKSENNLLRELHASTDERIFSSAELWNIRRRTRTGIQRRRFV